MENCQKFDNILFSVLEECKSLPIFFDAIFGFLNRRTDFYCTAKDANSPVGLPEGWAEEYVRRAFFKWKPKLEPEKVPEPICEVEVTTSEEQEHTKSEKIQVKSSPKTFTTSESYNGAVYDNYSWSQSIKEVDVIVKVPENVTTKQLSVQVLPKKLTVKLKNTENTLLEGELCHKCKHQDVIWSLDKTRLEIHLEKASEAWWDCLLVDEPKLDLTKLDCSRPYEELSEEAQAKIEELTWNQERKRLGLPTSDEIMLTEKMKKAWNAPGSPFSGPFNPDAVLLK